MPVRTGFRDETHWQLSSTPCGEASGCLLAYCMPLWYKSGPLILSSSGSSRHNTNAEVQAAGNPGPNLVYEQLPKVTSWLFILSLFTWSSALAAYARDLLLSACLTSLAIGSTIAYCLTHHDGADLNTARPADGESGGPALCIQVASYFWMLAAFFAWCRVAISSFKNFVDSDS